MQKVLVNAHTHTHARTNARTHTHTHTHRSSQSHWPRQYTHMPTEIAQSRTFSNPHIDLSTPIPSTNKLENSYHRPCTTVAFHCPISLASVSIAVNYLNTSICTYFLTLTNIKYYAIANMDLNKRDPAKLNYS